MVRWKKYSLITIGVIVALLLLSMLVVPWQIKVQGSRWFAEHTTRTLSIEKAFFNPFTLTVELEGVTLSEPQSKARFVAFKRLMLSASVRSLIDRALILDQIELDDPYVNIELLGKQKFNFSDLTRLGGDRPPGPTEAADEPLLFSFNNIVITGGKVDFTDQASAQKAHHQITELALSIPFIGNIPYLTDEYVKPHLRLLLNGSEIRAEGRLKPFHKSLETSLTLVLNDIDLAFYAFQSPVPLPLEVKSGILDTQINLTYRVSASAQPQLLLGGELALSDVDLRELNGAELFRLPTLILDLEQADLLQQKFRLNSLDLYDPELFVRRDRRGQWNFQRLLPHRQKSPEPTVAPLKKAHQKTELPLLTVAGLTLHDAKVHFQDLFPPGGFNEELSGINLRVKNLSTGAGQKTGLQLKFADGRDMTTEVRGELGLNPPTAALDLAVNGIRLKPWYPYLAGVITAPVEGTLDLSGRVDYTAAGDLQLQKVHLTGQQLTIPFSGKDRFTLTRLLVTGGRFDLQRRQVSLATIKLDGGKLRATRLADGSLSPLKLLRKPLTAPVPPPEAKQQQAQFALQLGELELNDFGLLLSDASLARKPHLKIDRLKIKLTDLAYPKSKQSPFKVSAGIGRRGQLAFSGTLAHSPLRIRAQARIKAVPLAVFNDFLPETVQVSLKDGKLFTNLSFKLQEQAGGLHGRFGGRITVSHFNLREPLSEGELLSWDNLNLEGVKGRIAPFRLVIKEVALSKYRANILINSAGRINLTSVTSAAAQPAAAAPQKTAAEKSTPPDIRIDAVTLQGGTVSFTDRSMANVFSTTMYRLGGRITGLSSDEQMQADVDLRGELENHSPLTITGKLNPLSKDLYANLTIRFKDIDLAPMTPYSGTYLGYVIDKGKLYLDLSYHIERQKIKADNRIMIDQFTFGKAVKSDKATSLPVSLAIALLKDSNDEIHLDVPISGDLNDPSFSIMGTVFTVLKNLLVKAATAPFSLLTSMLGGSGEDFTSITFRSGVARLDEKQLETLDKLAAMLAKRPALNLEISAFVDRDKDPEAYRKDQLRQRMIDAKWRELKETGTAPQSREQVSLRPEEVPVYLLKVYKEADFPRPRNFIGMLKSLPDAEMEKLLLANIRVGDEQLQGLAQARAKVVRDRLIAAAKGIKPRIFQKTVDIFQPPKKGPASRVEFNIGSK